MPYNWKSQSDSHYEGGYGRCDRDTPIKGYGCPERQFARPNCTQKAYTDRSDSDSQNASSQGDRQRFVKRLRGDVPAVRAYGLSHGNFFGSARRSNEVFLSN